MKMYTHIIIHRKKVTLFEGDLDQFKKIYFDNADMETVCEWAEEQGYEVAYIASNKEIY
jgi:hypothetical protein